jgi:hypothetical protein
MAGHGTVRARRMEGNRDGRFNEWIIRLALLALAAAAVWTVFGDDIGQFLSK